MINFFYLPLTIGVYIAAQFLQRKFKSPLLNPVWLSLAALIALLFFAGIDYKNYNQFSSWLTELLKPSVVALGVPLYLQLHTIKR
jgi:putative effector of murein hydrolase